MNSLPTTEDLASTLAEARRLASDLLAREQQWQREAARRRAQAARIAEQSRTRSSEDVRLARVALAQRHQEEAAHRDRRHVARSEWIQRAQHACRSKASQRIEQQDGRAVFGFQKGTLDADRHHAAAVESANEAYARTTEAIRQGSEAFHAAEASLASAFAGWRGLRRRMQGNGVHVAVDATLGEEGLLALAEATTKAALGHAREARRHPVALLFRWLPPWLVGSVVALGGVASALWLPRLGRPAVEWPVAAAGAAGLFVVFLLVRWLARAAVAGLARRAAQSLAEARQALAACTELASARHRDASAAADAARTATLEDIRTRWHQHEIEVERARQAAVEVIARKSTRARATHERQHEAARARMATRHQREADELEARLGSEGSVADAQARDEAARVEADLASQWSRIEADAQRGLGEVARRIGSWAALADAGQPAWDAPAWGDWRPPTAFAQAPRLGHVDVDLARIVPTWPSDRRLAFPGPMQARLPYGLAYPAEGALVVETEKAGASEAEAALANAAFRLLCQMPPGRLKLTILDPVGLGRAFSSLMHLSDFDGSQGGSGQRIWTEAAEIDARLGELTAHLEKVIQMYLRNEFATLLDYNAKAGSTAEHHHLLVVSGFPVHFSDSAARRLLNIAANGARCGILTLLHWDRRHPVPAGFTADDLRTAGVHVVRGPTGFDTLPSLGPGVRLTLDAPPAPALATEILRRIGGASRDANRVEVPFDVVAPDATAAWRTSTAEEIRVPIGRTGAAKLQCLSLGRGTRQHALISGKTGSGKSNLLHVIVTNLALWCSPAEIEFYLVDFKKGVEFKAYATARLPHARVVAIESDREFGLSVLERLDGELRRRGELFRAAGVQDVAGYRAAGGREPMPRCLLVVDEFQEYFVQEDRISQGAAVLLDRIVRQGRAFGVHVILASQTLGGTYALARATLGQMAVRIAFQCDEADAYLIMGDDNAAPRLLSRPGEGIYNDAAGAVEANSPFQAVWLPDEERDRLLATLATRTAASPWAGRTPVVFEGSAPAHIEDNLDLQAALASRPVAPPVQASAWLGAPNSIKGPTAAVFTRAGGSNLLVVGQRDDATASILLSAVLSLAAQHPHGSARFVLVDGATDSEPRGAMAKALQQSLPHAFERVLPGDVPRVIHALAAEREERERAGSIERPSVFLVILGLQLCKKLKPDDSFAFSSEPADPMANASGPFLALAADGPAQGIHVLASVDSYNNVSRYLGRKGLSEFESRVLLQMSAGDSSSLCDQPVASALGLHGALLYNDREGRIETFRPYLLPSEGWVRDAVARIRAG